ncbi:mitochondrial intermediate peptidase [Raphidocelis subcapitata]|uniref:Mitochondrial intermediate peptidase n=1 Tax=Raphidocelis subcapitata TaxID=307507 RepID=A0A2V0P6J5_9CHLO|nr:mitochondrial intermediate peptidase [Raphidocelis subcapitata]|eukprot:GBF94552.1 mitochondrial intermediate peptidase [Raphidocelis subcapitata]
MNATRASRPCGLPAAAAAAAARPTPLRVPTRSPRAARPGRKAATSSPAWTAALGQRRGAVAVHATADARSGAPRTLAPSAPPPRRLLSDFGGAFEEELGEVERLQAAALGAGAGPPLLSALGQLEAAAGALQRPARFFADYHPDREQAAAASAVLEVARLALAEVYGHPRVLAVLLETAVGLLPEEEARRRAVSRVEAAAAGTRGDGAGGGLNRGHPAPAVAAVVVAAAALDDALFEQPPEPEPGVSSGGSHRGAGSDPSQTALPLRAVQLMLACRQALRNAAAAHARQQRGGEGGREAGESHPYSADGSAPAAEEAEASAVGSGAFVSARGSEGASAAQAAVEFAAAAFSQVASDPRLSPVLLLTTEQAEVVRPLLRDAGMGASAWLAPPPRGDSRESAGSGDGDGGGERPPRLRCSRRLRMAPGRGGLLELTGLVTATEAAAEWVASSGMQQPRRQGEQHGSPAASDALPLRGTLVLPPAAPLAALRMSRDVVALLLTSHPNPDVRRQAHASGAAVRRRLLLSALSRLAAHRAALAAERGAPSYAALLLDEGSPMRAPAGAQALLGALADGVAPYAARELREWEARAARAARRAGRGAAPGAAALEPWDADYHAQAAAVDAASGSSWREFADYFTLPGLWAGLDRLLAHALGLRLLPPPDGAPDEAWAANVWHLQLWDADPPGDANSPQSAASTPRRAGFEQPDAPPSASWRLLGDVFLQVAPPGGFPFTTLLRPTQRSRAWWGHGTEGSAAGGAGADADVPGAVAVHLPLSLSVAGAAAPAAGDGAPDEPAPPGRPPALRGPFGLRALLHELGHAAALLAAGAAAPHPMLAGAGGAGGCGGVDLRELPSHAFEAWARDPRALSLLSCHWRLGVPLPPRDAARLARYLVSAGACTAPDFHEAALTAIADARLHALTGPAAGRAGQESSGSGSGGGGGGDGPSAAEAVFDEVWAERGVVPGGGASLEALRGLEGLGAVGGARWGYAAARLLAAAAWKRWFGDDALSAAGGAELKARLLYGLGAGLPPQVLLGRLLGPDALARLQLPAAGGAEGGGEAEPASCCWVPDLYSPAFQDVDLLG